MARAFLRLRPDGIHEIVSQHRTRRVASAAASVLVACALGSLAAAALSISLGAARAFLGGAVLAAMGLAGWFVRSRLRAAARPLASTIRLNPARVPPFAADASGARDAGA